MTSPRKHILLSAYAFYPAFGGLEQQMYLLAEEYIRLGYRVDILTEKLEKKAKTNEVIDGIRVYRVPCAAERNIRAYFSLIYNLSQFIITHRDDYDFCILRAALTLYPLVFGFWKFCGVIKYCTYVTADTGGETDEIIILQKNPLYRLMLIFFRQHNFLNSICAANYQHYLQLGFATNKLTRISNGIDISPYKKVQPPKRIRTFLFLGRFIKEKGIYELLDAFEKLNDKHPDTKLLLAGDGAEKSKILKTISQLRCQKAIIYKGVIGRKQIDQLYLSSDCLVLPSYSEGFSLVVAEATVRKRAIIATDVADLKKKYGQTIFWAKKRDVSSLLQQMELVINQLDFRSLAHRYDQIVPQLAIRPVAEKILQLCTVSSK